MRKDSRPTAALFVALIALVVALAGTAVALPGKNSVDKNDIKKNAVKSKVIKDGQVKTADIADSTVTDADLAPAEAPHIVGAGAIPFDNGGDGDCVWQPPAAIDPVLGSQLGDPQFFKDPYGIVHLSGIAIRSNGPGGDADCGNAGSVTDATRDLVVFILPEAYRPAKAQLIGGVASLTAIIVGPTPLAISPGQVPLPAGAVAFSSSSTTATLDGVSFTAAPAAVAAAKGAVTLPRKLGASLTD